MVNKVSAGLLMYRYQNEVLEVFLAHPGGPYLKNKDLGYWGIPKGEVEPGEVLLEAALREFKEETGLSPTGNYVPLGSVVLTSGKTVHAWAFKGTWNDSMELKSNLFPLEWPPHSGKTQWFPEIDRVGFFPIPQAKKKMSTAQAEFLDRLQQYLKSH
jgi:predicted NUDIX family NTP pyrophosphohydrolase